MFFFNQATKMNRIF